MLSVSWSSVICQLVQCYLSIGPVLSINWSSVICQLVQCYLSVGPVLSVSKVQEHLQNPSGVPSSPMSHVGQVGQSCGNLPVPPTHSILCVRPIPPIPLGQVGQFYGILPVPPTHSILCVCPIPLVPCRTSGTVLWNPTCPTSILNPMCLSYPICPM